MEPKKFLPLKTYLYNARRVLRKTPFIFNEDAIAYVAHYGILADNRYDPKLCSSRDAYRNINYQFALRKLYYEFLKNKKNILSINYEANDSLSLKDDVVCPRTKTPDTIISYKELYEDIKKRVDLVSQKNLDILFGYIIDGYTQKELGEKYNVTTQSISKAINKTLSKLRAYYGTTI